MSLVESRPEELEDGQALANQNIKRQSLWRNWHIASLMIAIAMSFVGVGLVAPLRTLYARSEGASGGEVGLISAAYLFSSFVFLFPFGWLSDRVNRVTLIIGGLTAHALIMLAYLPLTSGEQFLALRFLEGISAAAVLPSARALLLDLVPARRSGEAFGMMGAMMTVGLFIGPPTGSFLAEGFGYTAAYLIAALALIPAIGLVWYAFRNYQGKIRKTSDDQPKEKVSTAGLWNGPVLVGCLVKVSLSLGPGLGMTIWSLYLADLGYSLALIGWTYTVFAIPAILIGSRAGRLSDRYGRLLPMLVPGILLGLFWLSYGIFPFFLYFIIMGIFEGISDTVARAANDGYLADYTPAEIRGRAQGLFSALMQFGSLAASLAAGFLYELGHNVPFLVIGGLQSGLVVVALILVLFIRRKRAVLPASGLSL